MAFLTHAYNELIPENTKPISKDPDNIIAYAYGPTYSNGLHAYGIYKVERDTKTKLLYIRSKKEYLMDNGLVVGGDDKRYHIKNRM